MQLVGRGYAASLLAEAGTRNRIAPADADTEKAVDDARAPAAVALDAGAEAQKFLAVGSVLGRRSGGSLIGGA